jgi:glycerol-3-phosphate acyltransferase PlsY
MFNSIIAILIGYILGSILPAYFLGKWLKRFDIREVGTKNAGTTNVIKSVGVLAGIPTAIFDVCKGVLAILIAQHLLKTSLIIAYVAGFAAILGHIFPFYIKFKGGQGAATSTGIILYNLYQIFFVAQNPLQLWDLVLLVIVILVMMLISQTQELISVAVLPLFTYFLIIRIPLCIATITTFIIIAYLFYIAVYNILKFQLFSINIAVYPDFRLWRTLLRPAALAFPLLSFFISKLALVTLIGIVLAIFFITDIIRILNKRVGKFLIKDIKKSFAVYKDKEHLRISSMTLFLLGCFLSFLLFERNIAFTAIVFLIFGDMSAKILGLAYGKHKLFNKTLEGSLAHFIACIVLGYILHIYINVPLLLIFSGAFIATLIEVVPFNIDDNLSVPVITGAVLTIITQLTK